MNDHYLALMPTYRIVALLWFLIYRFFRKPWKDEKVIQFSKPWLELIFAFLAVVFIMRLGNYIKMTCSSRMRTITLLMQSIKS